MASAEESKIKLPRRNKNRDWHDHVPHIAQIVQDRAQALSRPFLAMVPSDFMQEVQAGFDEIRYNDVARIWYQVVKCDAVCQGKQ